MPGDRARLWGTEKMSKSKSHVPATDRRDDTALNDIAKALADHFGRAVVVANVDGTEVVVKPRAGRTLDS
jgi:hypothetical protein